MPPSRGDEQPVDDSSKAKHVAFKSPTAKRSPSILVTDVRKGKIKGAPFAGRSIKQVQRSQHIDKHSRPQRTGGTPPAIRRRRTSSNSKYSDITVSNLTSSISDVPSSARHAAPRYMASEAAYRRVPGMIRQMPQFIRSLPSRSSKSMQKLVLIPDETAQTPTVPEEESEATTDNIFTSEYSRTRAENMTKEDRELEYPRVTAYYIAEGFHLKLASKFLDKYHLVSPRLYDDMLYVPYSLPLLPGDDGFRVKSNNSAKNEHGNELMEQFIDRTEQKDHHYEFYSGVDVENVTGQSHGSKTEHNSEFDPSEPQFFTHISPTNSIRSDVEGATTSTSHDPFGPAPTGETEKSVHEPQKDEDKPETKKSSRKSELPDLSKHAEMFILNYGVVVFWNFTETHEKNILADLVFAKIQPDEFSNYDDDDEEEDDEEDDDDIAVEAKSSSTSDDAAQPDDEDEEPITLTVNAVPEQDIETEDFHFEYNKDVPTPRIYNDMITLKSGDHLIKLTISHAIAQSTKLSMFEDRMSDILNSVSRLPKTLALTGHLQNYTSQKLLMKTGRLLQIRSDVNLNSDVLDTPEYFWSLEPGLHPLYVAIREYLEIDQRVGVINDRCKVFLDFFDVVSDSLAKNQMAKITKYLIMAIGLSVFVSIIEIIIRYLLIRRFA